MYSDDIGFLNLSRAKYSETFLAFYCYIAFDDDAVYFMVEDELKCYPLTTLDWNECLLQGFTNLINLN